jgi:ATP-dependent Lhr-like helicase
VPRWQGGSMPMSSELAHAVLAQLQLARPGGRAGNAGALAPLLACRRWSACRPRGLLIETMPAAKDGTCSCSVRRPLGAHGAGGLLAYRVGRRGRDVLHRRQRLRLELLGARNWTGALLDAATRRRLSLFSTDHLLEDVLASLNATELSQRRFEIARIAGLVFQGYGQGKKRASCRPRRRCSMPCSASTTPATCC